MKKLIVSTIIASAATFSLVIVTSSGCGSTDKIGQGGNAGGSAGTPIIKLDAGASSKGGASGSGGSGTSPTGDANCGKQTSNTTHEPPDVLLLLDRSASMYYRIDQDCFCSDADAAASGTTNYTLCSSGSDCQTRWAAVQPAVSDTVSNAADVNWGLKFFPTPNAAQCSVSNAMEVPIGPDTGAAVKTQVETVTKSLSTPTAAAITSATAYLKTVQDNRPRFILLATDGEPNCRGGQIMNADLDGAEKAAKAAYDAGFPVYVVGIGPNLGNLTRLAAAGGTKDYYPVSSPQQLVDAFAAISKLVATCTFTLTQVPPDLNNVAVYLDKNLVEKDATNGWSFGGGNKSISLNGDSCNRITSGDATSVELLFGCPGDIPPPTIP